MKSEEEIQKFQEVKARSIEIRKEVCGCEYCKYGKDIYEKIDDQCKSLNDYINISGNVLSVDFGCKVYVDVEINYCPMCGRKLST